MSDRLSEWFGEERYQADLDRAERFWDGEGRCVVSVLSAVDYYRQDFNDESILGKLPGNLRDQAGLPGLNLPSFFPDFGTISTARYWGGQVRFGSGSNIFIEPIARTLEEALALEPLPVDHPEMDAARGLKLFKAAREMLETDKLWMRTPDMQGPLNTAGLVLDQQELMIGFYTEPEMTRAFLDRVTDFLIEYALYLRQETGGMVCGNIWPYTFFPASRGLSLTEDIMPLLPVDLYREFGLPCLRKLQAALGGLHIHCCGDWGRHAPTLAESGLKIAAAEFHHPATTLEELAPLAATGTVFVPYLMLDRQQQFGSVIEYYRHLLESGPENRFWFALADTEENQAFAREVDE